MDKKIDKKIRIISAALFGFAAFLAFVGLLTGSDLPFICLIAMGILLVLTADYIIANEFYKVAKMKGHNSMTYFWFSFICGATGVFGFVGYLLVISLPDRNAKTNNAINTNNTDELPEL